MQIPFTPELRKAVERYAKAVGATPSSAAGALLAEMAPAINQLADALEKAKRNPAASLVDQANILTAAARDADQMAMTLDTEVKKRKRKKS